MKIQSYQDHQSNDFGWELHKPEKSGHQSREKNSEGIGLLCSCETSSQGKSISILVSSSLILRIWMLNSGVGLGFIHASWKHRGTNFHFNI